MAKVEFKVQIQGDSEGFILYECPFCKSEFKLSAEEVQSDKNNLNDMFCPYCGLTRDKDSFYTEEMVKHIKALMENYISEQFNKSFGKMTRDINKSKALKMDYKPLKKVHVQELTTKDSVEQQFTCKICDNHVKVLYCSGASKIFCPYCGVDI
ncbi:MAG TPA: hypothetical protein DEP72_01415 [Clostridiales bacterium]|nr:hypothetical protein [Clostridiales bacterium]